jgi:DNA ligase (NAD+)
LDAIEDRRNNCELHSFICALGIPLVGSTVSKLIVKDFSTWDEFFVATKYFNFATIPGIGYEIENNLTNFQGYEEADILAREFLRFPAPAIAQASLSREDLTGRTFVITGKLINFKNRDALKAEIESRGGKVAGSVSKNTSYLINNDTTSTSSKNKSAQALGIPIISEQEFIEKFS